MSDPLHRRSFTRRILATVVALPVLALLAACSGTALVDALTPTSGYTRHNDVAYGSDPRQRLDVYIPDAARAGTPALPVVVFFYGGSWQHGDRGFYAFVGEALAARGVLVVIADYRVWPQVAFPVFVEDAARVVAWTQAHVLADGGDPRRIILAGHSAGAHMAALLALDPHYLRDAGATIAPAAFMGLAGPYDFLPLTDPDLKALFGPPAGLAATQPINFVHAGAPPLWLGQGTDDTTVLPRNAVNLAAKARSLDVPVTLRLYDGYGHIAIVAHLAAPLRGSSTVLDDMLAFIAQVQPVRAPL